MENLGFLESTNHLIQRIYLKIKVIKFEVGKFKDWSIHQDFDQYLDNSLYQSGYIWYQWSLENTDFAKYRGLKAQFQTLVYLCYHIFPRFENR